MRSHSYINSAKSILEQYKGNMPLAAWLKSFFSLNKKYGSKDRKQIAHLCYSFYRLGHAFESFEIEERLLIGIFLSSQASSFILQEQRPEWNAIIEIPVLEKLKYLQAEQALIDIFPLHNELSGTIGPTSFLESLLVQPSLYLRIRPGRKQHIERQLAEASIRYQLKDENCIEVENGLKLEHILSIDKEVVIQDYSSQQVLNSLTAFMPRKQSFTAWDCCAASGGKSLLLKDMYPKVSLTASDVRQSILHNLRSRFERAGITQYNSFVADVSSNDFKSSRSFDLILCDAPCSGSGTWSRTPEQLYFFQTERIEYYACLQKQIAINASRALKQGGYFLYITCSVFTKENEEVVETLQKETALKLVASTYHIGYSIKADTMFSALFQLL